MKKRIIAFALAVFLMAGTGMAFATDDLQAAEDVALFESTYDAGIYFYESAKEVKQSVKAVVITDDDFDKIKEDIYAGFDAKKAYNGEDSAFTNVKSYTYFFSKYTENGVKKLEITYEPQYRISQEQYLKYKNELQKAVKSLKLSGKSQKKKAEAIYKYICKNVKYRNSKQKDYTAYGALVCGYASCQGISALFYDMCESAGLECAVIYGRSDKKDTDKLTHAWNIVKIGSKWYNADATWDLGKKSNFKYFLKSDKYFEATDHYRSAYYASKEFTMLHKMYKP